MSDPRVVLVDYGVGNIASVTRAFVRLGADVDFTADPTRVADARRVVLPGVGAFAPAMERLVETGLDAAAAGGREPRRAPPRPLPRLPAPLRGERGARDATRVSASSAGASRRSRPGSGARTSAGTSCARSARTASRGLAAGSFVYFVHSFRPEGVAPADVAATCEYGGRFPAIVQKANVWGCQFHPEKSSETGRLLLTNFLEEGA